MGGGGWRKWSGWGSRWGDEGDGEGKVTEPPPKPGRLSPRGDAGMCHLLTAPLRQWCLPLTHFFAHHNVAEIHLSFGMFIFVFFFFIRHGIII